MHDCVDEELWRKYTDHVASVLKKPLYTIDASGQIVATSGTIPFFCQIVMKKAGALCNSCRSRELASMKPGCVHEYRCHAGLNNIAIPVDQDGEIKGALVLPALRTQTPDLSKLSAQISIDAQELHEYYKQLSAVDSTMYAAHASAMQVLASVLPHAATDARKHARRIAEMKVLLELYELSLANVSYAELARQACLLLIQHLRLIDASLITGNFHSRTGGSDSTLEAIDKQLFAHLSKTNAPLFINNLSQERLLAQSGHLPECSVLAIPLLLKPVDSGALICYFQHPAQMDRHAPLLLRFAGSLASGMLNASLKRDAIESALTDPLTGLYNKRFFVASLEQEITRSQQYKRPLSLMMIDVDNFKKYNDTYGHSAGDELLKKVASIMKDALTTIEILCRYGGEEFVVILPEAPLDYAKAKSEQVRAAIAGYDFGDRKVTVSIGLACHLNGSAIMQKLIEEADQALYSAKNAGKNRVVCSVRVDKSLASVIA